MRLTVNKTNIRQFVDDMLTKVLHQQGESNSRRALTNSDLNICSTIIQVCVQSEYKYLMSGYNNDERLSWFVKDVLFPLAHLLQITSSLPMNLHKKIVQLQNELARCLVDLSMRLESNMATKKIITSLCSMSLLDNPQRFMNVPPNQRSS